VEKITGEWRNSQPLCFFLLLLQILTGIGRDCLIQMEGQFQLISGTQQGRSWTNRDLKRG